MRLYLLPDWPESYEPAGSKVSGNYMCTVYNMAILTSLGSIIDQFHERCTCSGTHQDLVNHIQVELSQPGSGPLTSVL